MRHSASHPRHSTPARTHTFEGGGGRWGTHLARRLEGAETASTRAFLLMRFVRRDLCCISVFLRGQRSPAQSSRIGGNQEVMRRYPAAAGSYLQ